MSNSSGPPPSLPPNPSFVPPVLDSSLALSDLNQSLREYAQPSQALVFLDWDDTLFPTTHLRTKYRYPWDGNSQNLQRLLAPCGDALVQFLEHACMLSARCVILTLAQPGWIEEECLPLFDPALRRVFDFFRASDNLRIVYADRGHVSCERSLACVDWFKRLVGRPADSLDTARIQKLMEGKQQAMTREASEFYSRYPYQSWKNILSMGDSMYEYIAMQRLGSIRRARGGKERHLRSKVVRLQTDPSVTALTAQIRLFDELLPALVHHNGCLNLNLHDSRDPLQKIAQDLSLPEIMDLHPLRSIWDREWDASSEDRFAQPSPRFDR